MLKRCAAILLLLAGCPAALATPLVLCYTERAHPPFLMPDGTGAVPAMVQEAARQEGLQVRFEPRPTRRCLEEIRRGLAAGHPAAPRTVGLQSEFVFPPDGLRAVTMHTRIMLYRRVGSPVEWDGDRLQGLQAPALIYSGAESQRERLVELGVPFDEGTQTLEQLFVKLLAGRGDAALGWEADGALLLADPRFAGKVEVLARPIVEHDYFLMVSKQYWSRHGDQVMALWRRLDKMRQAR